MFYGEIIKILIWIFLLSRTVPDWTGDVQTGHKVIKLFTCPNQLTMKFVLPITLKLLTITNSFLLHVPEHENFSANKNANSLRKHAYSNI